MRERTDDVFIKETLDNNLLNRNKKLVNFVNLIVKQTENFTVSLNGSWGCGKTVFAKQTEYLFRNYEEYKKICNRSAISENDSIKNHMVYYFNAWENDMINSPVQSLIFQILKHFEMKYENSINLGKSAHTLFSMMVKIRTLGIIEKDDLVSSNYSDKDFKQIMSDVVQIDDMKSCFNEVINQILAEEKDRLVIIVDELDRCRPTYAIEMLECIKHFYTNDKLVFIVVTNNAQLSKTVKKVYGSQYDGDLYLQRFYDSIVSLNNDESTKSKYVSSLIDRNLEETHLFNEIIKTCLKYFSLELRQLNTFIGYEKTAEKFLVTQKSFNDEQMMENLSLYFCTIAYSLNVTNIQTYNDFIVGKWEDMSKFISSNAPLIEWFSEWKIFRDEINDNKKSEELVMNIYVSIFGNIKLENQSDFIKKIHYRYNIKNKIDSTLELTI